MSYKEDKNKKGNRWLKVGAWVFGIALFLFVGLLILTVWLENKMERMVAERSDGVYELHLYGLQLSPFIGNLSLDSLSLVPDYERWQELNSQRNDAPPSLLDLQSGTIELNGLNYLAVLFGSDVALDELIIAHPDVLMTVMREDTTSQQEPLHESAPERMQGLQIGLIDLDSGKISYRNWPDTASTAFSLERFNLTVDDIKLDSQSYQAADRAYYAANIVFNAAGANYLQSNGLYRLTVDSINLNTQNRILQTKQLHYKPTTDPASMARAKGEATTHMDLEISSMAFRGVDYPAHSRKNQFIAQHMLIQEPSLDAFKDKKNFSNRYKRPLPHELAQQMEIKFLLDTVEVKDGYARYEEIVPEAVERGLITLENMEATISNLSNMPEHISMENPAVVDGRAVVMGEVPAHITVRLPLLNENGYHTLHGEIDEADPQILNPFIEPTAFMRIESGHISRGSVDLELTNDQATGTLHLIYSNFEVELLSKGTGGEQSLGKEILSELANWIAIKESNPGDAGEQPRVGEIDVTHEETNSVLNYWTNCVKDGFMSIATIK